MKEVTVTAYCGNGLHHIEEPAVATVERIVSIDGAKPMLIDLCSNCDHEIVSSLLQIVAEDGQAVEVPKKKHSGGAGRRPAAPDVPDTTCPECGRDNFTSRHTRNSHLREVHDKSIREYG